MNRYILYISTLIFFFFFSTNNLYSQYRDPFSEKRKKTYIKKNNHRGLLSSKAFFKKQNDSFSNLKSQNGIIGIDNDPFKISGKNKFKPTGIEEDSFTKKQRKLELIELMGGDSQEVNDYASKLLERSAA